ncbi:MAG: methyl-accepting chemotaxis protein [Treponema sp.]|nr:methyl-accepting chemotaxis protein [Treponema sp.]
MKLKYKLSIMVIAIMIAVVSGIAALLLNRASNISMSLSVQAVELLAEKKAEYWSGVEEGYLHVLRTLANIMADFENLPEAARRDTYDNMLLGTIQADPSIVNIYTIWKPDVLDSDARNIGRTGSTPKGQYAMVYTRENGMLESRASADIDTSMAYFNDPKSNIERVDHPIARKINGKDTYLLRMMVSIVNLRTNEVVGGIGFLLDIVNIQPSVETSIENYEKITAMAIYSSNGFILASYVPQRIGKMMADVDTIYGDNLTAACQAVTDGKEIMFKSYSEVLETNLQIVMKPFKIGNSDTTWTVMIGTSEALIMKEVNEIAQFTIILALIAIIVTAVILFLIFNNVTRPIVKVTNTLKDISEGEGDLTHSIVINSKDEIGSLAHYFNLTLEKIKNLVIIIKNQSVTLFDIGSELASNMNQTAAAINEITANIQSIKTRVMSQSASVTETNATMEQVTTNINKLNDHVEKQSTSVAQSSSAIEQMLANIQSVTNTLVRNAGNVKELMESSEVGKSGLNGVALDIQEISRESEGLMEINSVMKNIASQTNLLSMNAAIEAAHAGDSGKGFAVVADEIRKLAESSSEQSKTIGTVLKHIKASIDKISGSTENVLHKFEIIDSSVKTVADQEDNIRNAMEEQGQGSHQVLEAISQVNGITQQVKNGSQEMLIGSKEVINESKNLERVTQEITGSMNEMATGTEQINIAVHRVSELSNKNRENIDLLVREVSKFKVM